MKIIKRLLVLLLAVAVITASTGCYIISSQKMNKVKGTYKLTQYTRINKYERKEGYTPTPINYLEDEEYKYEDYLVVTGSGMGYYIHKDANNAAYVKEVTLSYQYDAEDSSKIDHVIFNDSISVNAETGINKLGVTKNSLNYSKSGFDYTELITKRKMRSEDISVRWTKVDKATDLTYVEKQLGTLKKYDYQSFGVRGIYELGNNTELATGNILDNNYQYFYYVIDTANNATTATAYYALKESPTTQVVNSVTILHESEDWSSISIDGTVWTVDPLWNNYYYNESDGLKRTLTCVSNEISNSMIQSLISMHLPNE